MLDDCPWKTCWLKNEDWLKLFQVPVSVFSDPYKHRNCPAPCVSGIRKTTAQLTNQATFDVANGNSIETVVGPVGDESILI